MFLPKQDNFLIQKNKENDVRLKLIEIIIIIIIRKQKNDGNYQ